MLAADKEALAAHIKQRAILLRNQELEFLASRYVSLAALSSISMGFAFDGITELEVPEEATVFHRDVAQGFYLCAILTFALAMYVVIVASFVVVYGQRLALQGTSGHSLDRAVAVLSKQYWGLLTVGGVSLISMLGAVFCLAWLKMTRDTAWVATAFMLSTLTATIFGVVKARHQLLIRAPSGSAHAKLGMKAAMVRGDVHLDGVNLATVTTAADGKHLIQDRHEDEGGSFIQQPGWMARSKGVLRRPRLWSTPPQGEQSAPPREKRCAPPGLRGDARRSSAPS